MRILFLFIFASHFFNLVCSDKHQQQLLADLKSVGLSTEKPINNQDHFYQDYFNALRTISWYQQLHRRENKDKVHGRTYTLAEVEAVLKESA